MDEKLITVLEYAKSRKVSKQAIYQQVKSGKLDKYIREVDGQIMLIDSILSDTDKSIKNKSKTETRQDNLTIEWYKQQIENKDKQISNLTEQLTLSQKSIADLTTALLNAQESLKASQALHAHDTGLLPAKVDNVPTSPEQPIQSNISFWGNVRRVIFGN